MMKPNHRTTPPEECAEASEAEIQAVRVVLAALITAVRNYSLYPPEHSISQKCIRHLSKSLAKFFKYETRLKIDVNKDWLSYKNADVYNPATKNDPLLTPLFRDGVLWIAILSGIQPSELKLLLDILFSHRMLKDEAEGDLVTALWKANLPNVRYQAIDSFWENRPAFDFNDFRPVDAPQGGAEAVQPIEPQSKKQHSAPLLTSQKSLSNPKLLELTATERQLLCDLILRHKDAQGDVEEFLDILMAILDFQTSETDFIYILDLIEEELKVIFANARFGTAHAYLEKIKNLECHSSGRFDWRNKLINDFFYKISLDEILEALEAGLLKLDAADSKQLTAFRRVMLMLQPQAVYTLADLLLKVPSRTLQLHLMDIIKKLSLRNLDPLERLINNSDAHLLKKLITIVSQISGNHSKKILLRLLNHHSENARRQSLFWLTKRGELSVDQIHALMEDRSPQVRAQIIHLLSQEKNPTYERILRSYIEKKKFKRSDRAFLIRCYQTLGRCASDESVPFLEKKLLKITSFPLFSPEISLHRQGAAAALIELETPDAKEILNKASRCIFPHIRRAYKKALEFRSIIK